jgi:hypothetical protein
MFADNAFGGNDNNDEGGADWADGFGDEADKPSLDFAKSDLTEVLNSSTPGNKQKNSGLGVMAALNWNTSANQLQLELQFSNQSGKTISEFDLMINKNSFGVGPDGVCSKMGIGYP